MGSHGADHLKLLPVFFAEDGRARAGKVEEACDDLADTGEVAGALGILEAGLGRDVGEVGDRNGGSGRVDKPGDLQVS